MNKTSMHTAYTEGSNKLNASVGEIESAAFDNIQYSEATDFSGNHLAVGDKVHYGFNGIWEIVEIDKTKSNDRMHVTIKSGENKVMISKYGDGQGNYVFRSLKLGKVNGGYILKSISNYLDEYGAWIFIFIIFGVIPLPGLIYCILKLLNIV